MNYRLTSTASLNLLKSEEETETDPEFAEGKFPRVPSFSAKISTAGTVWRPLWRLAHEIVAERFSGLRLRPKVAKNSK